jgi:hypothetical protein
MIEPWEFFYTLIEGIFGIKDCGSIATDSKGSYIDKMIEQRRKP